MSASVLISTDELADLLENPKLLLLDTRASTSDAARGRTAYLAGHIPGARFVDFASDVAGCCSGTNGRNPLPDSGRFCVNMRRLGLNPDSIVVVYDDGALRFASRLWYTLRWVGIANVRVLNGGYGIWRKQKRKIETGPMKEVPQGTYRATTPLEHPVGINVVEAALEPNSGYTLIDARPHERFLGRGEKLDKKGGHIPGSLNRPATSNVGADGLLKPVEVLRQEFADLLQGRDPNKVIQTCGSGIAACSNQLAMEAAGLPSIGVYIGSWSEWVADPKRPISREETVAVTPAKP